MTKEKGKLEVRVTWIPEPETKPWHCLITRTWVYEDFLIDQFTRKADGRRLWLDIAGWQFEQFWKKGKPWLRRRKP